MCASLWYNEVYDMIPDRHFHIIEKGIGCQYAQEPHPEKHSYALLAPELKIVDKISVLKYNNYVHFLLASCRKITAMPWNKYAV